MIKFAKEYGRRINVMGKTWGWKFFLICIITGWWCFEIYEFIFHYTLPKGNISIFLNMTFSLLTYNILIYKHIYKFTEDKNDTRTNTLDGNRNMPLVSNYYPQSKRIE